MKRMSSIGVLLVGAAIVFGRYAPSTDIIQGALMGGGMCFIVFGLLPDKAKIKLKQLKQR
ncbi:MAG: hypothetical protein LBN43_03460 [Oscillospiraceae bacterium]|jgi:hypothetical protein|nr:hypothetical protein [Oscillospiraceae bacterium]